MKCFALLVVVLSVVCAINAEPARHGGRGRARFHSRPKLARFVDESTAGIAADEPAGGEVADAYPELFPPSFEADAPQADQPAVTLDEEPEEIDEPAPLVRDAGANGGSNAFFPINFGRTNGGVIAVANSFSTGNKGSATSNATAYGSN